MLSKDKDEKDMKNTHSEPFRTLGAKTKAFETQAYAGLAVIVLVGLFVAFLLVGVVRFIVGAKRHVSRVN